MIASIHISIYLKMYNVPHICDILNFSLQNLGHNAIDKMISTLKASVETMLRVLTAGGGDVEDTKCNASFADMGWVHISRV